MGTATSSVAELIATVQPPTTEQKLEALARALDLCKSMRDRRKEFKFTKGAARSKAVEKMADELNKFHYVLCDLQDKEIAEAFYDLQSRNGIRNTTKDPDPKDIKACDYIKGLNRQIDASFVDLEKKVTERIKELQD